MEKDFRCVQFIDIYYPLIDGVVSVVNNYATYLNRHGECSVVAPRFKDHVDKLPYDVYRTKGFRIPSMQYMYGTPFFDHTLYRDILKMRPQILHAHSPFEVGKFALRIGEKLNAPVIGTFHSKYYDDFMQVLKNEPLAHFLTDNVVRFYEKCDYVWTVNNATARTLKKYGYKGDVSIIPNGADLDYYAQADALREKAIKKYDLPRDKKIILFVGQITWKKNLKLIIDSISKLRLLRDDFMMVFIGSSYQEDEINDYAEKHAPEHTLFLGQVSEREMLAGIYAASELLFFPSLYDNASLVIREAAQMHVPSLFVRDADTAEGVEHMVNGFLAENDEHAMAHMLDSILSNPELLDKVGAAASKTLAKTWAQVTEMVLEEYRRIASETSKRKKYHTL